MARPFTSAASLHSPSQHMPRFQESFGSPSGRYTAGGMSRASMHTASSSLVSYSPSSSYLRSRGAMTASPLTMRGGTSRERGGASGNQLVSPALQRKISSNGTPMRGVMSFPFDKQQTAYIEEFAPSIASQLVHPFNAITENNADSTSFNIITGSAYQGAAPLHSEYKRQFKYGAGSFLAPVKRRTFGSDNPGLRSEEMITVGQYTPVLRSF